jgi:hypothetical protein
MTPRHQLHSKHIHRQICHHFSQYSYQLLSTTHLKAICANTREFLFSSHGTAANAALILKRSACSNGGTLSALNDHWRVFHPGRDKSREHVRTMHGFSNSGHVRSRYENLLDRYHCDHVTIQGQFSMARLPLSCRYPPPTIHHMGYRPQSFGES